jgi:ubiquitin C-terminal hydrolase
MPSGGLGNNGATCAVNALIQCITHTPLLRRFFLKGDFSEDTLAYQFKDVIKLIHEQQATVSPNGLLRKMYSLFPNILHPGEQHDICELWMLISDKIAEETGESIPPPPKTLEEDPNNLDNKVHHILYNCNNKKTSKWIQLIQGIQLGILQCNNCLENYHNPELFTALTIDIPINRVSDLTELLLDFYKVEKMDADGWKCDKCGQKQGAKKQTQLAKLPKILIVVIKRFLMNDRGFSIKIQDPVDISEKLDFNFNNKTFKYKLVSYGNHHGNCGGGHYTATVCNEEWLYYDDTNVHQIKDTNHFTNNREAYILFYEMIND